MNIVWRSAEGTGQDRRRGPHFAESVRNYWLLLAAGTQDAGLKARRYDGVTQEPLFADSEWGTMYRAPTQRTQELA